MTRALATKTGRAGGASAGLRSVPRLGYELQGGRGGAEGSAQGRTVAALSELGEALTGGSWRHELATMGSIGGVRLA